MKWGGVIVSAALVAIAMILAILGGSDDESPATAATARFADPAALAQLETENGHPVYWAGERPARRIEVVDRGEGGVYLRYLPPGVPAGDPRAGFLTVGTYPVPNPVAALRRVAKSAGAELRPAGSGAVLLVDPSAPGSVYLAHPHTDVEVEVYDPAPGRALRIVLAGEVRPVGD